VPAARLRNLPAVAGRAGAAARRIPRPALERPEAEARAALGRHVGADPADLVYIGSSHDSTHRDYLTSASHAALQPVSASQLCTYVKCQSALFKAFTHVLGALQVIVWRQVLKRTVQAFGIVLLDVLSNQSPGFLQIGHCRLAHALALQTLVEALKLAVTLRMPHACPTMADVSLAQVCLELGRDILATVVGD